MQRKRSPWKKQQWSNSNYRSTIVLRGLRESHIWVLIMPRDISLSDNGKKSLGQKKSAGYKLRGPSLPARYEIKIHRFSERLTPLKHNGSPLKGPLKLSVRYWRDVWGGSRRPIIIWCLENRCRNSYTLLIDSCIITIIINFIANSNEFTEKIKNIQSTPKKLCKVSKDKK